MRTITALVSSLLVITPAAAQRSASGHIHYGPEQTISCLQGGAVIIQYAYAWAVDYTWTPGSIHLQFNDANGVPHTLDLNPQAITCLIEPYGQGSVPIIQRQPSGNR